MSGILYGIGVGPGDGQLLTIRAYRLLTGAKVIAVPVKKYGESSRALILSGRRWMWREKPLWSWNFLWPAKSLSLRRATK